MVVASGLMPACLCHGDGTAAGEETVLGIFALLSIFSTRSSALTTRPPAALLLNR